jgi:hypothetical protein
LEQTYDIFIIESKADRENAIDDPDILPAMELAKYDKLFKSYKIDHMSPQRRIEFSKVKELFYRAGYRCYGRDPINHEGFLKKPLAFNYRTVYENILAEDEILVEAGTWINRAYKDPDSNALILEMGMGFDARVENMFPRRILPISDTGPQLEPDTDSESEPEIESINDIDA